MKLDKLAEVRDQIAMVSEDNCNMRTWLSDAKVIPTKWDNECETAACIAGHTVAMHYPGMLRSALPGTVHGIAKDILGIEVGESNIFFVDCWPGEYQELYEEEGDQKAMITLIDDLISGKTCLNVHGQWFDSEGNQLPVPEEL